MKTGPRATRPIETPSEKVIPLRRSRAAMARAQSQCGKTLLNSNDLARDVRALAPLQLYFAVKELGADDAAPILRCSTAAQFQTIIDIDCWQGDQPDMHEIDAWLAPCAAAGKEALASAFLSLDSELQILFLAQSLAVFDPRSEAIPEPSPTRPQQTTPDRLFVVQSAEGIAYETDPLVLVDALYRHGLQEAFSLLMAAKWETRSPLEEDAFRFRCGRLEDLGFLPPERARSIFARPTRKHRKGAVASSDTPGALPALYATPLTEDSLFGDALKTMVDPGRFEALDREFICLVNTAVVAYGESPKDLKHVQGIAARVRDTLSLGLQADLLSAGEARATPEQAAELLGTYHLVELFQIGHREVMELGKAASDLGADPCVKRWLEAPTTERDDYSQDLADRAFLAALSAFPPLWAGWDPLRPEDTRAFSRLEELAKAQERLDEIARRVAGAG